MDCTDAKRLGYTFPVRRIIPSAAAKLRTILPIKSARLHFPRQQSHEHAVHHRLPKPPDRVCSSPQGELEVHPLEDHKGGGCPRPSLTRSRTSQPDSASPPRGPSDHRPNAPSRPQSVSSIRQWAALLASREPGDSLHPGLFAEDDFPSPRNLYPTRQLCYNASSSEFVSE
jgi:hypothetical protein